VNTDAVAIKVVFSASALLFHQSGNLRIRKDALAMYNCPGKEKAQTRCALFLFTAINN